MGVSTIVVYDGAFQYESHQPGTYTEHRPEATADGTDHRGSAAADRGRVELTFKKGHSIEEY